MSDASETIRPSKGELLLYARAFVAELCGPVLVLRRHYAAKNIAAQLDRAWKEWEREQKAPLTTPPAAQAPTTARRSQRRQAS